MQLANIWIKDAAPVGVHHLARVRFDHCHENRSVGPEIKRLRGAVEYHSNKLCFLTDCHWCHNSTQFLLCGIWHGLWESLIE